MMRSLSSAVAGLRTHQTKMDVIGNNIANVNTYGYKASRTTFADVFYQNLATGSGPTTTTGGTNPTQIGYGSMVATIDILNTQAGATTTDRALDVYITGDGFLVTQDSTGNFMYTRLGNMGFDAEGNLIDPNGNYVMGFPQNADGSAKISADGTATATELQNIKVDKKLLDQLTGISISTTGEIIGQLPGDTKITLGSASSSFLSNVSISSDSNYQGSLKLHVGAYLDTTELTSIFANTVSSVSFGDQAVIYDPTNYPITLSVGADGAVTFKGYKYDSDGKVVECNASGTVKNGKLTLTDNASGSTVFTIVFQDATLNKLDETPTTIAIETKADAQYVADTGLVWDDLVDDAEDTTNANNTSAASAVLVAEYRAKAKAALSTLTTTEKYELTTTDKGGNVVKLPTAGLGNASDLNGTVMLGDLTFTFSSKPTAFSGTIATIGLETGETINIGCIVLAKFRNAAGLMQSGSSNYVETANSGEAIFVRPGLEGTGSLKSSNLEMSNVDISKEMTDMITTQRGFQANSRIITVSDSMLEELVNLKR